jgi:hypothetical protein
MHTTLFNETNDQNISSFDDFDFENEDHAICAPINSMIHNFLDASKINDYENVIYSIIPNQKFHPLGLFRDNHSKELNGCFMDIHKTYLFLNIYIYILTNSTIGMASQI